MGVVCLKSFCTLSSVFFLLALYILPTASQVIVIEPPDLAAKWNESKIVGSTAAFGTPYYGERVTGQLYYFNSMGCVDDDYKLDPDTSEIPLPAIVMVKRGQCHFVSKVQVAEKKGAKAVIVMDGEGTMSTADHVKTIIMADDGWGDGVKIPSLLIGEVDGLKLVDAAMKKEEIILELAWDIPKDHSVQMDMWMSPAITQSINFLKEYAEYAKQMKTKLDFRPHYWIISLPGNFKDMCTDDTGRFCGLDPDWGGSTTGRDTVEESVRQLCLWETTQYLDDSDPHSGFYSEKWWMYMEGLGEKCPHNGPNANQTLGEVCSYNFMNQLGVNVNQVKKCYEQNFESLLTHELLNKAWSPLALMVNNWRYSGPLDPEVVMRAVCTGFKNEQEECRKLFHPSKLELMQEGVYVEEILQEGFPLWAVILLSTIGGLIGVAASALVFWKFVLPKIRSSMRYAVMDEVRKEVVAYERDNVAFTGVTPQPINPNPMV